MSDQRSNPPSHDPEEIRVGDLVKTPDLERVYVGRTYVVVKTGWGRLSNARMVTLRYHSGRGEFLGVKRCLTSLCVKVMR